MVSSVTNLRDVSRTSLPNGIRVITETVPHVRSVSIGVWIGTGARRETPKTNGISHFIEHMLFKGSANRSAEEIAREADSTGGNLDAYTAKELVSYNIKVLDEHLPVAFDLLSDLVLHPRFDSADIEKEKGVILEELKMEVDNPEYLVHETFFGAFWKNHPLGRSILGTKATISGFDQETVREYYEDVYGASNILITAAGNISHSQIVQLASDYFGGLPPHEPVPAELKPQPQTPLILKNKRSLEQTHLCMGVPAYPIADERRYGTYLLSTILGGGMSSRLFQNIREKHGLAYSIFSELNLYRDSGCLAVYAGTSSETLKTVIAMCVDEFRQLCNDLVPADELRRAKDHLKGSLALSLESTSARMSNLARQELFFGRFQSVDEMMEGIERVTASQIQEMARDFFGGKQVGVTALGRVSGIELAPADVTV